MPQVSHLSSLHNCINGSSPLPPDDPDWGAVGWEPVPAAASPPMKLWGLPLAFPMSVPRPRQGGAPMQNGASRCHCGWSHLEEGGSKGAPPRASGVGGRPKTQPWAHGGGKTVLQAPGTCTIVPLGFRNKTDSKRNFYKFQDSNQRALTKKTPFSA